MIKCLERTKVTDTMGRKKLRERKLPSDNCVAKEGKKKLDGNCVISAGESANKQSLINSSNIEDWMGSRARK